jgi:hypothetical protein
MIIINEQYCDVKSKTFSHWLARYKTTQPSMIVVAQLNKDDKLTEESTYPLVGYLFTDNIVIRQLRF